MSSVKRLFLFLFVATIVGCAMHTKGHFAERLKEAIAEAQVETYDTQFSDVVVQGADYTVFRCKVHSENDKKKLQKIIQNTLSDGSEYKKVIINIGVVKPRVPLNK